MARLFITEFGKMPILANSAPQCPFAPGVAEQLVTFSGSSTASLTFSETTSFVMVNTDTTCSLAWSVTSDDPTAVTSSQRVSANETRFYGVRAGGKLAVIQNT